MDKEIDLEKKIKELDNIVYKVVQSAQTVHILTKPQVFYDDTYKQALGYQNPFYLKKVQWIKPTLYDGSVISKQHVASLVFDDEETLILEELNRLSEDFGKRLVPQQELSDEQTFWLQISHPNTDQSALSPLKIEAPRELPKVTEVQTVFNQMEAAIQYESCVKCLNLDAELLNKQNEYNDFSKRYSQLEKHCISLELTMQLNQEIFQKESFTNNQNALEILEYFENNDLKAQLQAKDTTISFEKDLPYQFDSIKKTCDLSKEHDDSLIAQLNSKSMENADLKHQLQDKVFVITSLKNDLRKLKGKETVETVAQIPIATIVAPGMFKLDLDPLALRLLQNREAHIYYLKHTQEQADIL
ncbi:hypothetical protein Tco_0499183 [Tanacetum coccineum]